MKSMKNLHRFLSLVLVLLLVTSCYVPAVSADSIDLLEAAVSEKAPCMFFAVNPVTVKIACDGIIILVSIFTAMELGDHLGKQWDGTAEGINKFASDVGAALSKLYAAKNGWIYATTPQAEAILKFDYLTANAGSGGKKNDKLYHKAERDEYTGKVKINTKRISEKDAVKELREGRDIFTAKKELAEKVVDRASKENHAARKLDGKPAKIQDYKVEKHGPSNAEGYYEHYHPKYQNTRPHCWYRWGDK